MKSFKKSGLLLILTACILVSFSASLIAAEYSPAYRVNQPYAFDLREESAETMRVQFVANKMYHEGRYLGFGVSGKPMLSVRYMAEMFGFWIDADPKTGTYLVTNDEYSFRFKPGSNLAEIYWAGEKVGEMELTERPLLRNNVIYLYSLDISDLLGLITIWDDSTRTWDVLYSDYTCQELGFPMAVNDDLLVIKGLLFDDGIYTMPRLEIMDTTNQVHSSFGSISYIEAALDSQRRYEMSSTIQIQDKTNQLQVTLTLGQRIIFAKKIEVAVNIEAKELVVDLPYQITSPTKGYVKTTEPQLLISGSVAGVNNNYPWEVVLFVRKADNMEILLKESVPIIDGQFMHKLELKNGEGLYKATVNSIMAAPHGLAYPEITNFYLEYRK